MSKRLLVYNIPIRKPTYKILFDEEVKSSVTKTERIMTWNCGYVPSAHEFIYRLYSTKKKTIDR